MSHKMRKMGLEEIKKMEERGDVKAIEQAYYRCEECGIIAVGEHYEISYFSPIGELPHDQTIYDINCTEAIIRDIIE